MRHKHKKRIMIFGAVFGLLLFLHYAGVFVPVERSLQWALNPVMKTAHRSALFVGSFFAGQRDISEIGAEMAVLRQENRELLEANVKLQLLEDENAALRDHLLFQHKSEYNFLMANIVARGDTGMGQQITELITIDRGRRHGLTPGLAVVSGQGTLVGKLAQVSEMISEVELSNNPAFRLAAKVINGERTSGIVQGDLGLTLRMDYIPQSVLISPDDAVVTSGLEENIPAGLLVGRVSKVRKESNELWQQAVIEPLLDPEFLSVVAIVVP